MVIGISGLARAGKDTLCQNLIKIFEEKGQVARRFSLADKLKGDLRDLLIDKLGIDIFNCSHEDKELIRPIMVTYGYAHRIKSEGTHWTKLLGQDINDAFNHDNIDVAIVTDIRYNEYPEDELYWLKNEMKGQLVHLRRYELKGGVMPPLGATEDEFEYATKRYFDPPNDEEARNDPTIYAEADTHLEWVTSDDPAYYKLIANQVLHPELV